MTSRRNPISKSCNVRVGITIGDPSGIGPAITVKALWALKAEASFTVFGDALVLRKTGRLLPPGVTLVDLHNVDYKKFSFGRLERDYGRASLEYLDAALAMLDTNVLDCLVTCPISKEAISLAGCRYPGHTEYLAARTGTARPVMLLLNDKLKIALVTHHIPLKDVSRILDRDKIAHVIAAAALCAKTLYSVKEPRLAVCGLNPHASDNGLLGNEERDIILPAVLSMRKKLKIQIDGPLSADVALSQARDSKYSCAVAMYHDQALIALKLSGKETGVNMTLGLPFIRTSPLHGTAFDIAGKFRRADPSSLIRAIRTAIRCTQNQRRA